MFKHLKVWYIVFRQTVFAFHLTKSSLEERMKKKSDSAMSGFVFSNKSLIIFSPFPFAFYFHALVLYPYYGLHSRFKVKTHRLHRNRCRSPIQKCIILLHTKANIGILMLVI